MATRVPDGGWGWMVVFGGAIHSFIGGGLVRSFSLIFESVRERYDCSASAAAWVYALNVMTALMTGPMSAVLVSRFGVRRVVMVGGLLVTTGIIGMACATSLAITYVTFGLIAGLGNGLVQLPKLIAVSYWFDRRRGTATSLALMTDGFGSLALSPFFVFCFAYYGYQGTLLILAGFTLQYCISGALYRKPYPREIAAATAKMQQESLSRQITDEELETASKTIVSGIQSEFDDTDIIHGSVEDVYLGPRFSRRMSKSLTHLEVDDVSEVSHRKQALATQWRSHGNLIWNGKLPEHSDDILPEYEPRDSFESVIFRDNWDVTVPLEKPMDEAEHQEEGEKSCADKCTKYLDYRLLRNVKYVAFSAMMTSGSLCFSMVNTHFAGLAKERQHTTATIATLLGVMGIVNTAVKFLSGLLFDWPPIRKRRSHVFSFLGMSMGLVLVMAPSSYDVTSFYVVWLLYMSTAAILGTQESLILSDIVSRSSFPSAIGMSRFCRGLGVLVGPTFGGYLKDSTGIYMYTFIFGGSTILVTSAIFEVVVHWSGLKSICRKIFGRSRNPMVLVPQDPVMDSQSKRGLQNGNVG